MTAITATIRGRSRHVPSAANLRRLIRHMPRGHTFAAVEAIGRTLPDVEVTTTWGKPALKVRGRMFVCVPSHRSAEPHSLVVMMDFAEREALLEDDPATYYLKDHYVNYPCVLVRLQRVSADALRDVVAGAHRYMTARGTRTRAASRKGPAGRPASRPRTR